MGAGQTEPSPFGYALPEGCDPDAKPTFFGIYTLNLPSCRDAVWHSFCMGFAWVLCLCFSVRQDPTTNFIGGVARMRALKAALLVIAFSLCVCCLQAQTATEAGSVVSESDGGSQLAKMPSFSSALSNFTSPTRGRSAAPSPVSSKQRGSGSLIAPSGPPPDKTNRGHFEQNAGPDAGRVLFRSVPSGAAVFIDDMLVGDTPVLIFLAPGRYDVGMRGSRLKSGQTSVDVMPKETQTVKIDLSQRYPSSVSLHW